jgi:hypothetical protein
MKNTQTLRLISLIVAVGAVCAVTPARGQQAKPAASAKPSFPSILPGRGLAQHDFFYAGEAKSQDMYIVRNGKVAWEFHDPAGKGEISDAVLLSNGNVLFAHQFGVALIDRDKKVLWRYDAPPGTEIHTAQPIGNDRVLYVQNGDPAKVVVVNIVTGKNEHEFVVPVRDPKSVHGHFRHARLTEAGTLLVAHMDLNKVVEYDSNGKELWSHTPGTATWSAERLKNGFDRRRQTGSRGELRRGHCLGVYARGCAGLPVQLDANRETAAQWGHAHQYLVQSVEWAGRSRHRSRSGARSHAGQESRLGVAGVGEPGGSRTFDHDSVTRRVGRSRGGAFRRFEMMAAMHRSPAPRWPG